MDSYKHGALLLTTLVQGVMPSPSGQLIKVVIRSSTWLEPDTTTPIILPDSIMPNERAEIPSQLRALIRHEVKHRDSGERLNERDTVSLLAYSERLHRAIPEFSGGVHIIIQYPLQLACKSYVDCMEKGDEMTMSWTVTHLFFQLTFMQVNSGRSKTFQPPITATSAVEPCIQGLLILAKTLYCKTQRRTSTIRTMTSTKYHRVVNVTSARAFWSQMKP